ncbi:MAG: FAD-dependent oxidoreductase [Roseovarius sp.]|nr:FAD-dependent oxidoreductase [Roseovarius sp.]
MQRIKVMMPSKKADISGRTDRRRIAVIGTGISGLGAAWLLSRRHDVTVFEADRRPGGHARTVTARSKGGEFPVDTGFIVFNRVNYPNLCQLFNRLGVAARKSDMSFAVSVDDGAIEYGSRSLGRVIAQPKILANPRYWRMFGDIARFNRTALADATSTPDLTLGDLIQRRRLGSWFEKYYLLPMSGAIWSAPRTEMLRFPAIPLIRFFANHGLLSFRGHHQWWTVKGGSITYVNKLAEDMSACMRLSSRVEAVTRNAQGVKIKVAGQDAETFDSVVLACHADETLAILRDAKPKEKQVLGGIPFRRNRIVLHTDARLMPRRRACWSSWVYLATSRTEECQASVTYWMNSLQGIPDDILIFATLNPSMPIDESRILDEHVFEHPQYDAGTFAAQADIPSIQGQENTWHCGAWTGMGFHEDGLASAVLVARKLGAPPPWD